MKYYANEFAIIFMNRNAKWKIMLTTEAVEILPLTKLLLQDQLQAIMQKDLVVKAEGRRERENCFVFVKLLTTRTDFMWDVTSVTTGFMENVLELRRKFQRTCPSIFARTARTTSCTACANSLITNLSK